MFPTPLSVYHHLSNSMHDIFFTFCSVLCGMQMVTIGISKHECVHTYVCTYVYVVHTYVHMCCTCSTYLIRMSVVFVLFILLIILLHTNVFVHTYVPLLQSHPPMHAMYIRTLVHVHVCIHTCNAYKCMFCTYVLYVHAYIYTCAFTCDKYR